MPRFADVILPKPLYAAFTYSVPDEMSSTLTTGCRVLVQFGARRFYTAIVVSLHDNQPQGYTVKPIIEQLDDYAIVRPSQLKLWKWISEYYLCSLGDVYKAAVPSGLKVESETFVSANPDFEATSTDQLKERELVVLDYVASRDRVQVTEISKATGLKNVESSIMRLLAIDALFISEKVVENYRPLTVNYVTVCCERTDSEALHSYFDMVHKAKKQEKLLLAYLDMSHFMSRGELIEVEKNTLLARADVSAQILSELVKKGVMKIYKKEVNRFKLSVPGESTLPVLTKAQNEAYFAITDQMKQKPVVLLRGVTSSGKTEIYINLISELLRNRRQVLYLVPEIALTTQLTRRLQAVFGNQLLIYHSRFSDNERVDIWKRLITSSEPCIVIGARSSVFLPFTNLGLVIVDEEHETSFKQQEPAPRYNARDVAIVLATMHGAKTLLGTATPSIETYYKALSGKYGLVELTERYEGIEMPEVELVDIKAARKRKEMVGLFSHRLIAACRQTMENGNQVILFQNRRGYAPITECSECAWIPKCVNCDVSLTYHKHTDTLVCHYCGYTIVNPKLCPSCGQSTLEIVGYGTERIEDDIQQIFGETPILRMDLDTTRNKNSYERIIDDFSSQKAKILVGTQMVTKGLDFGGVKLVGVLNADTMINFPDFRSSERAFNMLEQVSGRAGRKNGQGLVIIQTSNPSNPMLKHLLKHDYVSYYNDEIAEREQLRYPPFSKIINIYLKHRDDSTVTEISVRYSNMLREVFGTRVLGPEATAVPKVQQMYIRQIMLKMENQASMPKVKAILRTIYEKMITVDSRMKSTVIYYDVDPM